MIHKIKIYFVIKLSAKIVLYTTSTKVFSLFLFMPFSFYAFLVFWFFALYEVGNWKEERREKKGVNSLQSTNRSVAKIETK
ncbi:hypothetical protein HXZ87_16985 [Myroides sp. R163-1]|nr:hypothetical protein [Myroides sp. R163-1]